MACGGGPTPDELQAEAEAALDALATELAANPPADAAAYATRLQTYLEAHPDFYGSAVALLDGDGKVTASPYVFRGPDGYVTLDLAVPDYDIDAQTWVTAPLAADAAVWTDPYFDAGGGEIWMITRSIPLRNGGGIFAIATTDIPVNDPNG